MDVQPVYYLEYLTVRTWLTAVVSPLLRQRRRGVFMSHPVFFVDATRLGLRFARATQWVLKIRVAPLRFQLVDIRDEQGLLIRLRIANRDLAEVQADAMESPVFKDGVRGIPFDDPFVTSLAKTVATVSLFDRGTLWRALLLIQVCAWEARKRGGNTQVSTTLFLERRPWFEAIRRYAERYNVTVVAVGPTWHVRHSVRKLLGPHGVALVRNLRSTLDNLTRVLKHRDRVPRREHRPTPSEAPPKISVEYSGHFNLGHPELYSDLFFLQQSALSGRDLVLLFLFPQDPLDEEKVQELTLHGITAVPLYPGATTVSSVPVFISSRHRAALARPPRTEEKLSGVDGGWFREQAAHYAAVKTYWKSLFQSQNIKMHLTWYRYDERHCAITDALRELGGISAIYQRALQVDPSPEITVNTDVMFGYSPLDAQVERRSGSMIPYHVAVGYFGDHRFPLLQPKARALRVLLQQQGADFVVSYFDENSGNDPRWHTGHEFMRENYAFLLEKVLTQPRLGLVLKPKCPGHLRRRLGPVVALLDQALATGRCSLFDEGILHSSYPPAVAALASDLAIHGHLCAGGAGFEAALAGVKTLLLDREGWSVSPLYELGLGRVVFQHWEALWEALECHRAYPNSNAQFGDWSPLLARLDPFRDGRGAERMGSYLGWLLEGLKAGRPRERVLQDAADRYMAAWGNEYITRVP